MNDDQIVRDNAGNVYVASVDVVGGITGLRLRRYSSTGTLSETQLVNTAGQTPSLGFDDKEGHLYLVYVSSPTPGPIWKIFHFVKYNNPLFLASPTWSSSINFTNPVNGFNPRMLIGFSSSKEEDPRVILVSYVNQANQVVILRLSPTDGSVSRTFETFINSSSTSIRAMTSRQNLYVCVPETFEPLREAKIEMTEFNNWVDVFVDESTTPTRLRIPQNFYYMDALLTNLRTQLNNLPAPKSFSFTLDPLTHRSTWSYTGSGTVRFGLSTSSGQSLAGTLGLTGATSFNFTNKTLSSNSNPTNAGAIRITTANNNFELVENSNPGTRITISPGNYIYGNLMEVIKVALNNSSSTGKIFSYNINQATLVTTWSYQSSSPGTVSFRFANTTDAVVETLGYIMGFYSSNLVTFSSQTLVSQAPSFVETVRVVRYSAGTLARNWTQSFGGGDVGIRKSNLLMIESPADQTVYISYKVGLTGTNFRATRLSRTGALRWTSPSNISVTNSIGNVIHQMYNFEGTPMWVYITTGNSVVFRKFNTDDGQINGSGRVTALGGFSQGSVQGIPCLRSNFPWDNLFVGYVSATNVLTFNRYQAPLTLVIPGSAVTSEISEYQYTANETLSSSFIIYRASDGSIRLMGTRSDNTVIFKDKVLDSSGYFPCVASVGTNLVFLVTKFFTSFSEYIQLTIRRVPVSNIDAPVDTTNWQRITISPATSITSDPNNLFSPAIRPRMVSGGTRLSIAFCLSDGTILTEAINVNGGEGLGTRQLPSKTSNVSELALVVNIPTLTQMLAAPSLTTANHVTVFNMNPFSQAVNYQGEVPLFISGDTASPKTNLSVRQSSTTSNEFYVLGRNAANQYRVSQVRSEAGVFTIDWTINLGVTNALNNRLVGTNMFVDSLLAFYMETTGTVLVCKKVTTAGTLTTRTRNDLTILPLPSNASQAQLLSSAPFESYFMAGYKDTPLVPLSATSTTNHTLAINSKTFTLASPSSLTAGQRGRAKVNISSFQETVYVEGVVSSYVHPNLVLNVDRAVGETVRDVVTSTTSTTLGSGERTFTVNRQAANTNFQVGQRIQGAFSDLIFIDGTIVSYTTNSLTVNVTSFSGTSGDTYSNWTFRALYDSWIIDGPNWLIEAPGAGIVLGHEVVPTSYGSTTQRDLSRYQHLEDTSAGFQYVSYHQPGVGARVDKLTLDGSEIPVSSTPLIRDYSVSTLSGTELAVGTGNKTLSTNIQATVSTLFTGRFARVTSLGGVTLFGPVNSYTSNQIDINVTKIFGDGPEDSWREASDPLLSATTVTPVSGNSYTFVVDKTFDEFPLLNGRQVRITTDDSPIAILEGSVNTFTGINLSINISNVIGLDPASFSVFDISSVTPHVLSTGNLAFEVFTDRPTNLFLANDKIRVRVSNSIYGEGTVVSYVKNNVTRRSVITVNITSVVGVSSPTTLLSTTGNFLEIGPKDFNVNVNSGISTISTGDVVRVKVTDSFYGEGIVTSYSGTAFVVNIDRITGKDENDIITSSDTLVPSIGILTYTVNKNSSVGRFVAGDVIRIRTNESNFFMDAVIDSYSGTTLVIDVVSIVGSIRSYNFWSFEKFYSNWTIVEIFRQWTFSPLTFRRWRIATINPISSTSNTLQIGSRTFTTNISASATDIVPNKKIRVKVSNTVYGQGFVTSYVNNTLIINITEVVGVSNPSTIYSSWTFATQRFNLWTVQPADPTSTTTHTLQTGSLTFTTDLLNTETTFVVGERIRASVSPLIYGDGVITSFSGNALTIAIDNVVGGLGGLYSNWTFTTQSLRSSTSNNMTRGTKTFNVNVNSLSTSIRVNQTRLRITPTTASSESYLEGIVTGFSSNVLLVNVDLSYGPLESYTSWNFTLPPIKAVVDPNGFNPSIVLSGGFVYSTAVNLVISLTDYATISVRKMLKGNLVTVWSRDSIFPESSVDGLFPRMLFFNNFLHVIFARENNQVFSLRLQDASGTINPPTPYSLGLTINGSVDKRELVVARTPTSVLTGTSYIYVAFPTDTEIKVVRFNQTYERLQARGYWERNFGGDTTSPKNGIFMEEDILNRSVVLGYSIPALSSHRVTRVSTDSLGVPFLSYDGKVSGLSSLVENRLSGMYVFDEFILLFGVTTGAQVSTVKLLVQTGDIAGSVVNSSVGLSLTNRSGKVTVLSFDPWSRAYVSYILSTNQLPRIQTLTNAGSVTIVEQPPETSQYQMAIDDADVAYPVYYGGLTEGVSMTRFTIDGEPQIQRRFDLLGQTPSIRYVSGDNLYVAYTREVNGFTSYVGVVLKKIRRDTLLDVWSYNKLFTDTNPSTFRPRILVLGNKVYVIYKNNSNQIVIQTNDEATGFIQGVFPTFFVTTADPREIVVEGYNNDRMLIMYPSGASGINIASYNLTTNQVSWVNGSFESGVVGAKDALVARVNLETNVGYISYSTTNGGTSVTRVAAVNLTNGNLIWSKAVGWAVNVGGVEAYKGRVHGFFLNGGLPILFAAVVENALLYIRVVKLDEFGEVISTRTRQMNLYDQTLFERIFLGYPAIFSRELWEKLWIMYPNPTGALYSNWKILVNKLEAAEIPEPTVNSVVLSDNQFTIDENDNMYLTYIKETRQTENDVPENVPAEWLTPYGKTSLISYDTTERLYLVEDTAGARLLISAEREPAPDPPGFQFTRYRLTFSNRSTNFSAENIQISTDRWFTITSVNNFLTLTVGGVSRNLFIAFGGRFITDVLNLIKTAMNSLFTGMGFDYSLNPTTFRSTWTFTGMASDVSFRFPTDQNQSLSSVLGFQVLNLLFAATYTRSGDTVTITTPTAHGFLAGYNFVTTDSVGGLSNRTYVVKTVISATEFTVLDITSGTTSGTTNIRQIEFPFNIGTKSITSNVDPPNELAIPTGMTLNAFSPIASLAAGQSTTRTLDINFDNRVNVPLRFIVRFENKPTEGSSQIRAFPCALIQPMRQIKMYARYTKETSPLGRDYTRLETYVENKTTDTTFRNLRLTNLSVPEGVEFAPFPTISSISPGEILITYLDVRFQSTMNFQIGFEVRSSFETLISNLPNLPQPPAGSTILSEKGFTTSFNSPNSDLDYGVNGPNVINLSKVRPDGVVVINKDIDVGGQDPAIYTDGTGEVFSAYVKRLVTFTDFMSITVQKTNSNLMPQWIVTRKFSDSFVDFFKPRIKQTFYGIHLIYFRQSGSLIIETLDPFNGQTKGEPFNTGIVTTVANTGELSVFSSEEFLYLALPTPSSGLNPFGTVTLYKYNMANNSLVWSIGITGGTTTPKTGIFVRISENDPYVAPENVFVGFVDNGLTVTLAMVTPSGTLSWTKVGLLNLSDVYGKRFHGMYVSGGYPSAFFIRDLVTKNVCTAIKLDDQGNTIDTRSVDLPTLPTSIKANTYPIVLSRSPWDVIFMEYFTNAQINNVSPLSDRLGVVAVTSNLEYTITIQESELSEFQTGRATDGSSFITYSVNGAGVRLSKLTSGGVLSTVIVDPNGQSPSLYIYSNGTSNNVVICYVRNQFAFLSAMVVVRKVYTMSNMTLLHTEETYYPDAPSYLNLRPRLLGTYGNLYASYVRQDGHLYIEQMTTTTAVTKFISRTEHILSSLDPLTISVGTGPDNLNIAYPSGSNTIVRKFLDEEFYTLSSMNNSLGVLWTGSANVTIPAGNYFLTELFEQLKNTLNGVGGINKTFSYSYDPITRTVTWSYVDGPSVTSPHATAFEFNQDARRSPARFLGFPVSTTQHFDAGSKSLISTVNPSFVGSGVTITITTANNWVDCARNGNTTTRVTISTGTFTLTQVLNNLRTRLNQVFPTMGFSFVLDSTINYRITWSYTGTGTFRFEFSPNNGESLMRFLGFTTFVFPPATKTLSSSAPYATPTFLGERWSNQTVEGGSGLIVREDFGTLIGLRDLASRLKIIKLNSSNGSILWTRDIGSSTGVIGGRLNSLYNLFNYPVSFNVNSSAAMVATKLNPEGVIISTRTTNLTSLNVGQIQNYPVVVSGGSWGTMTLGYYAASGVGSITTSPTKTIVFANYTATPIFPTPLPAPEISDQQVAVNGDHVFFVHANDANKLLVSKHLRSNPSTILNSFAVTAAIPFSPSVRYIDNKVVLSYCTYTVSFTEIIEMFVDVLNPSTLSLLTRTSRGFPDPSPDTFRPRLAVSGGVVHRAYVRFDNNIFIENFNPSTNITRDPFPTNISYTGGDLFGLTLTGATDPLDKTVYLIYPQTTNLNVRRYSNENYVTPTWSVGSITGGLPAEPKTHPIGRVNQSNDALYLSTTSGGTKGVIIKLQTSSGQVQWNTTAITVPSSTRVTQGMDVFEGFPMMYTILSSNNSLVVSKVNDEGSLVSSRTTALTGFAYTTNVSGLSPFVVSLYPWNHVTVFHNTNVTGLNYSTGRDVAIRAYTANPINVLPATNNEIRTSQGVYEDEGAAQVTEYTVADGTRLYYFNGTSISNTRVISNVAYRPSVGKLPADDFLINAYAKTFNTFTEIHTVNLRRISAASSLTDGWIRDDQLILPEGSNGTIRPLVRVYASAVFLVYVRETGKMVIERRDRETGALIDRLATPHVIPEASELVIGGDYDLCIAHTMKPLFPTKFKVIKYEFSADTTQPLIQRFATEYEELNGLQVNSLDIIQNISENIMVTYLAFDPSINLQRAFIVRISQITGNKLLSIEYGGINIQTGQRRWTISPTERLSGINNEGSFTNSARVSVVVESGVTSIKVDLFETNPSFKTIRYNFGLFDDKPPYLNTPLVMYNKGEGWTIIAYRGTDNIFRILREQVGASSIRVNYDNRGYATTPGYDYWWRPLITINPSIRGSDIEENVIVSGGRISRRWHANGHLYFVKLYSWYNIDDANNWLDLIENSNPAIRISVPPGRYNITQVLNILLAGMNTLGSKTYKYILDPITKRVTWTFMLQGSVSFGFSSQAGESLATVLGFQVTPQQQIFPLLLSATYTRTDNKVTITTPTAHGFPVGYKFVIVGSTGGLSNGTYKVITVITTTQFTFLDTVSGTASGTTNIQQITGPNPVNLAETNNISGPEYYFSKNGQWAREVVNHSGNSYLREWTLPERTDVEAVFKQFDTNNDGLISTSGAGNELDIGLSSYGITIPPQERVLLVNAMKPDEQGRVGLSRFSQVMPTNEYTRDIFEKIGRDQVIKTLDCEIINGVRSSHAIPPPLGVFGCKEYFSLLPANRLLRESNYSNGKLVGTVRQYFNTGVLENIKVYNTAGKITSNQTNWPNGNKREEVSYNPPGVESGVRFSYDTDGITILAQTIIETTRPDNPNIKLRVTTFWGAGIRKIEYYLDDKQQRTDVYREFFNTSDIPQKISLQGNYFKGRKVGAWLTYNIAGQVINTEVFPPYRP